MVTGLMDTVCPPSSQFAAYNKIKSEKKVVLYPDFAHEAYPGLPDLTFEFLADLWGCGESGGKCFPHLSV
jgi:cephalosporin-C deacetylase